MASLTVSSCSTRAVVRAGGAASCVKSIEAAQRLARWLSRRASHCRHRLPSPPPPVLTWLLLSVQASVPRPAGVARQPLTAALQMAARRSVQRTQRMCHAAAAPEEAAPPAEVSTALCSSPWQGCSVLLAGGRLFRSTLLPRSSRRPFTLDKLPLALCGTPHAAPCTGGRGARA